MKILLLSPDRNLQGELAGYLGRQKLLVDLACDGEEGWHQLQTFAYDVLVLQAALPKLDGLTLCGRLRDIGNTVLILLLTEAGDSDTFARGLSSGADACLARPFQETMLLAQLHALSRGRGMRRAKATLDWGGLQLDPISRRVNFKGQSLTLNRKEYQLVELLLSHPTRVFSQSDIADRVWTLDEQLPTEATVRSHMRSLRRKLEKTGARDLIATHYGQGYCLNPALSPGPIRGMDSITENFWNEAMAANTRLQAEMVRREQVEADLRRTNAFLRAAQQVARIGCWEVDLSTREIYWTEELFLLHGLTPSRSAPTYEESLALIHPDDRALHDREIRTPALKGQAFEANLRIVRANDGQVRLVNARGGPVLDAKGKLTRLLGTTCDITRWGPADCPMPPFHG
jgi:PAS domain S-box-containing protein